MIKIKFIIVILQDVTNVFIKWIYLINTKGSILKNIGVLMVTLDVIDILPTKMISKYMKEGIRMKDVKFVSFVVKHLMIQLLSENIMVKAFVCKKCKKPFSRKDSLQKHWQTHSS